MEKEILSVKADQQVNRSVKAPRSNKRVEVLKTYKIYVGGQFPRTESGRYYTISNSKGDLLANMCLSSKKDFRDAVVVARAASKGWSARSAFNRSQILYRIGEMLESRKAQFVEELVQQDMTKITAQKEVTTSIDRVIYYAGWCDKYQQLFSSVNPVASSHFNFSVPEPTGVVAAVASENYSLLGLVSVIAPVIAGGNTIIILASEKKPLCAVSFAEVLNSSDVPAGVVNILTGKPSELCTPFASHMDVNAIVYCGGNDLIAKEIQEKAATNVKRVIHLSDVKWLDATGQSPYFILNTQEIKTTWHPIESIGGGSGSY